MEGRVAKPYSFGKRFLDEFLSTLNIFHFDSKGLCCALSEDVYNLIPLPALMSTVTAWQPQEGKFARKDPKKDIKCRKDFRSWSTEPWASLPPPSPTAKVSKTSKRAPRLTWALWQIRHPRRYHPTLTGTPSPAGPAAGEAWHSPNSVPSANPPSVVDLVSYAGPRFQGC